MSTHLASLVLGVLTWILPAADDERDLALAGALARRGWFDLADEICGRLEKTSAMRSGVSIVRAEIAVGRARQEPDALQAAHEIDGAIARLRQAGASATLEERTTLGWVLVQKARRLAVAADGDAAVRAGAIQSWEEAEGFYRELIKALDAARSTPEVDEALLDARLELPKSLAAHAKISGDAKLLKEALERLSDFQLSVPGSVSVVYEAMLEEGRCLLELKEPARAAMKCRSVLALRMTLAQRRLQPTEYHRSLLDGAQVLLLQALIADRKFKEAVAACDQYVRDNPGARVTPVGLAVTIEKAKALEGMDDLAGALAVAQMVILQDPDGPFGAQARDLTERIVQKGGRFATPDRLMMLADGLIDKGQHRSALAFLRQCLEACSSTADRAKFEPVTAFKRGECLAALKRNPEALVAYQEVFRKYPKHELAPKAGFEAVRCLCREFALSGEKRDEERMEKLLDEVERLELQGASRDFVKFLRAEILEGKGRLKAAADLYRDVSEMCEAHDEALVRAGHCYRRDGAREWEAGRKNAAAREAGQKLLARSEETLKRAVARLEKSEAPSRVRHLAVAYQELALLSLHEAVGRPKEAFDFLERCAKLLPPDAEALPRIWELEILALLRSEDFNAAAVQLEKMLSRFPGVAPTARSCHRVAIRLETADPARARRFYRGWLDCLMDPGASASLEDVQAAADGLYRIARSVNGFDDRIVSAMDLKGKPVTDRAVWKEAARVHEILLATPGLKEEERTNAEARLAWCHGLAAQSPEDWRVAKNYCETLVRKYKLLAKDGTIDPVSLQANRWLAGVYFEYGAALQELGRSQGQKFQFGNALTTFNNLVKVSEPQSKPWWTARYRGIEVLFERGEQGDLEMAARAMSTLETSNPDFDGGKFEMKDKFIQLREKIKAVRPAGK